MEELPNQELIDYLIKTYYGDSVESPADPEDERISSYWKYHSSLFSVERNSKGQIISLKGIALGDHQWPNRKMRFLDQACILFHLSFLNHRFRVFQRYRDAAKICKKNGLDPTMGVFRHCCAANLIDLNVPEIMRSRRLHFLMIGDGFGMLSAIIKKVFPESTIFFVDIGKTLLFQAYYLQKAYPSLVHQFVTDFSDPAKADFIYCPAESLDRLGSFRFDIAVNIASMQEMNEKTIPSYFDFMRNHFNEENRFYCCNRDYKQLSGGEMSEFLKYPWNAHDKYFVDGACPWYKYFFAKGDFGDPVSVGRLTIPLVKKFEFPHLHRLAVMQKIPESERSVS